MMNISDNGFRALFDQLGLPSEDDAIQSFLKAHAPLPETVKLADAPFWSPAQARFLRESLGQDAEWAHAADQLNAALRAV